jgi:hypothetical protein
MPESYADPSLLCRTIYNMCTQKPPHDYSEQLYNKFREAFTKYITASVSSIEFGQYPHARLPAGMLDVLKTLQLE